MKKILVLLNLLVVGFTYAQTNLTQTENYIYEKNCLTEDCSKKTESVQYLDGLGRVKQNVAIKATPSGKDIAIPVEYDAYGRQVKSYLPVPQSGTQNGALYADPLSNASSQYGNEKIYTEKVLESSPLGRMQQQRSVGNDWAAHPVQFSYATNTSADAVKKYTVVTSWAEGRTNSEMSLSGAYSENTLYKSAVTDEDGNVTTQFKNKKGQTVLTRKKDGTQNADTYYIYNEYGGLAYTLPPLASASALTSTVLDNLCYQYRYDGWNRLVEKKIPGKGWEYMVYDKQDRLVLAQDANLRTTTNNFAAKGWMFTKYDQFGRVVYTGFFSNTATRTVMQTAVNSMTSNLGNNEARSTTPFTLSGMDIYYTKGAFPTGSMKVLSINYYDTYPSYSFNPAFPSSVMGKNILSDNSTANAVSTKSLPVMSLVKNIEDDNWTKNYVYYDTKGRAIGTHSINHLGGYTKTESDLDFAGATKQTKVYHKRLNTDTEKIITQTYTYDNQNRLLVHKHKVDNNPEEILAQNEYNELSQLKNKKVGGTNTATPLQSIDYTYNIRGQLTKINDPANLNGKLFGYEIKYNNPANPNIASGKFNGNIAEVDWKNASEDVLKRYDYSYDHLNRLQDAIYSEPNSTNPFNNNFNENLTYDLNGNISTLKRNAFPVYGTTSTLVDDLTYQYTGNRLDKVIESSFNDTGYEGGNNAIAYDLNGNMKDMKDKGIQSINYNYLNVSNQISITQTNPLGQVATSSIDYLYRADGVKLRKNYSNSKGRGAMLIRMTDYLDGFQYSYEDNGSGAGCLTCKTEVAYEEQAYKAAIIGDPVLVEMPKWKLDFVATAEGFYSFTENRYIYQYKDHVGNTRVSFGKNNAGVVQAFDVNNFYPFGLNHIGGSSYSNFGSYYSYKYNGKELQETGFYDYGWRQYMPDIARWNGIDQLAEKYLSTSTYAYVAGNPVSYADVDGRWFDQDGHIIDTTGQTYGFLGSSFKPAHATNFLGINPGDGGGGNYTPFGQTGAYNDLMTAFYAGGTGGLVNQNGTLKWWTDYDDPDSNVTGIGQFNMLKLSNKSTEIYSPLSQGNTLLSFNGVYMSSLPYRRFIGTAKPSSPFTYRGIRYYGNGQTFLKAEGLIKTQNLIKLGKGIGIGTVLLGGILDWGYGVPEYRINPNSPNAVSPQKASLNTGVGVYGLTGVGTIPSLVYFGLDNFYPGGFNGYVNDVGSAQTELDNSFNNAGPYRINLLGAHEPK
jgi:RHS repeat-associated protein